MTSFYGVLFCVCMVYSLPVEVNNRDPIVLIVSFDGFRPDYVKDMDLPKIKSLISQGSSAEHMINVFETLTFPNHQSIATGLYPESHGVIANSLYDPKLGKILNYSAELYEYEGVIPIWTLNEMSGRHSGSMMWPGSEFPYGKDLKKNGILPTFYLAWNEAVDWHYRVDTAMDWMTHNVTPTNLVMLYFEEPDTTAHVHGPESSQAKEQVKRVDDTLAYICDKIVSKNLSDIVNMIVVSDHGLLTVTPSRIIDLSTTVNTSLYTVPNYSPTLHIHPLEGYEDVVFQQLSSRAASEAFTVYRKDDMPERWHTKYSRRAPPIIAVADGGYVFQDFYYKMDYYRKKFNITPSRNQTYGVHGYDNSLESMHSFFFAWGPLFKKGYVIPPFESVDLFPLVSKILGLPSQPVNGSSETLDKILVSSNPDLLAMDFEATYIVIVIVLVIIGVLIMTVVIVSKRRKNNGYDWQMEQNQCQSILKDMGVEEQRLLSDSDEDQ
ncbi:ectonucleotide pyrophosphatase/phosphodiesterase family member 5-like isoform X2 [Ischnura elegans]|uniref:ectonucleotide pyrophosphatase/phosphodiesterase family member 5-like isoform X2 n=1 Tax=Ischnura elegans TaxID=197161 RepID=UPI001ED87295|nr:ectonucleotide pyrophosphatase/phosphodiesterase family member 5-like isoform X2 [Ischnura elegans]